MLHERSVFVAQTGDSSIRLGLELLLTLGADRELSLVADPGRVLSGRQIEQGHLTDQMVEGRPQIVDAVTEDEA